MAKITFVKDFPFSKSPAICIWQGNVEYPICYLRKAKGCSDELFNKFIETLSMTVKQSFLDEIDNGKQNSK